MCIYVIYFFQYIVSLSLFLSLSLAIHLSIYYLSIYTLCNLSVTHTHTHTLSNSQRAVALAIIHCPRWEDALRNTTDAAWGGKTTPLRKLIRKMPEVAEEVFNRCTVSNATKDGKVCVCVCVCARVRMYESLCTSVRVYFSSTYVHLHATVLSV